MDMPSTVRVGPFDYDVQSWAANDAPDNVNGECALNLLRIRIRDDMVPQKLAEVLLHEVLHAMWDIAELGEAVDEETAVSGLGKQLLAVIRDNPELIDFVYACVAAPEE